MISALLLVTAAAAEVPVDCAWTEGMPWCSATVTVDAPVAAVGAILADYSGLPGVFPRIESVKLLAPETIHVILEMPFPLAPRDYIARFTRTPTAAGFTLSWEAAEHPDAPMTDACVRLLHTAGTWTVEPLSETQSTVSYRWNAELGGDVPGWALPRAWQMQGDEVLGRLKTAAEASAR